MRLFSSRLRLADYDPQLFEITGLSKFLFYFVLFMWWSGNYSITESLPEAEFEIVVCSDKFVGTALVPTKLVETAVPTNLSEQITWCSNGK